jgi:hypothetical protein
MKKKATILVWAVCGYSCIAQVSPIALQTPAAGLGLSGGGAAGAVMTPRPLNPPATLSAPGQRSTSSSRYSSLSGLGTSSSAYTQIPSLVLKFTGEDEASNSAMEEDLAIMTKLVETDLKKGVGEGGVEDRLGFPMLYTGTRSVRAMYMEGFGVLFMIKVNFPVFAPDQAEARETARQPELSDWEQAKRQLYGQQAKDTSTVSSRAKYNQAQVDTLKKLLMLTMRNATNIHNLRPEEWLSFSVFGHPVATGKSGKPGAEKPNKKTVVKRTVNEDGELTVQEADQPSNYAASSAQVHVSQNGTVMTLRARRGDIESFARGKTSLDEFSKLVQTQSYFGNGYGVLSLNSWMMESSSIAK